MMHTPGPWRRVAQLIYTSLRNKEDKAIGVALGEQMSWEEQRANARLIAAAPDMMIATEILARLESSDGGRTFPTKEDCAFARAIIAKVRGE